MKTRQDFKPDLDFTLKDLIKDELLAEAVDRNEVPQFTDESIDQLMKRIYEKVEREALATYHSNEPWALRAWALQNIFKEQVADEAISEVAHNLISPVLEWQQAQSYDPVARYREKLVADGKPPHSITACMMPIVRFVGRMGRERSYTDSQVIEHISYLRTHGYIKKVIKDGQVKWLKVNYKPTTLYNEITQLKQFFKFLHGRNWELPVKMPEVPDRAEMYQPMLSEEEVEALIFSTIIDLPPADWIIRLACSTLYGCRASELGDIESKYIHLDGFNSSIYIRTRKKGVRKAMLIPPTLLPLFSVPTGPMKEWKLIYIFKSMCKKAGIKLPERAGWHSIRRRAVTDTFEKTSAKEMEIISLYRWSMKQRHLSQLPTYVKNKPEESDRRILLEHPLLKMWETVVPYLVAWHPEYKLYNEMI